MLLIQPPKNFNWEGELSDISFERYSKFLHNCVSFFEFDKLVFAIQVVNLKNLLFTNLFTNYYMLAN